ncbi:G-protein coupled receptor 1 isoform X1 [Lingula anatina]|uniref:G-protein coupled receptor 1 isoform X1 n=1 Tax=Lingula anatina TaxID=7574 RepID=A0A1S3KHA5_LINAN|nr:G-protein coupled receptor 1 isoform X1 [Lingula anatina]XP_013421602.1 G-protein coupled receptor 1 isoform X1 [Lingula anatina]|eukprot:XP_013421601.1 G-protein coupled receptor 1 isoform X1 [Lingula anatina]
MTNGTNRTVLCGFFPDQPHRCELVAGIYTGVASLSFVFSILVVAYIVLFKRYVYFSQRLIMYLCITSTFDNMTHFWTGASTHNPTLCEAQAFFEQFWGFLTLFWEAVITLNMFVLIRKNHSTQDFEDIYVISGVIITVIVATVPFTQQAYGPSGIYCWVKDNYVAWRIGIWYGPLYILLALMFTSNIYIAWYLRKLNQGSVIRDRGQNPNLERMISRVNQDVRTLLGYPIVYLVLAIFTLANRIHNAGHGDAQSNFGLVVIYTISITITGTCNAVVFGWSSETRHNLKPKIFWAHLKTFYKAEQTDIYEFPLDQSAPGGVGQDPVWFVTSPTTAQAHVEAEYGQSNPIALDETDI